MTMLAPSQARRFRALYTAELAFVWTALRRLGVDDSQVEDAAHDVFVVVHRQLDRFEGRSSERTWLYAITRRIAWRYRRTQRRRDRRRAALAAEAPAAAEPEQDELLQRREADTMLRAFLESLDRPKREAFVLGEIERLPRASLGRALGVSPGTAYSRLRAARADFAAAFGPDEPHRAGVHRLARRTEPVPRRTRQRLWLALPGGWLGHASGSLVAAAVAGVGIVGLVALRGLGGGPTGIESEGKSTPSSTHRPTPTPALARPSSDRPTPAAPIQHRPTVVDLWESSETATVLDRADPSHAARRAPGVTRPRAQDRSDTSPPATPATDPPYGPGITEPRPADPQIAAPRPSRWPTPVPDDHLAQEAALMTRARAAMRARQWDRAWTQLAAHAERFPAGDLTNERRASAVVVACRLGRRDDARARARALLSDHPPPDIVAMLRSTCASDRLGPASESPPEDPAGP